MDEIKWLPNGQPTFPVTGKTGRRQLTILSPYYTDYLKKWIELHPKGTVPSSYLIYSKKTGGKLTPNSLWSIYIRELKPHFTKLLDEAIGQDDRKQIEQLLLKPWNPYLIRHSTVTEYLVRKRRLSGKHANQWFGWKKESNMAARYEHFYGNEAEELLAESFGLKAEVKKESSNLLELRVCPNVNCGEPNNPDAPFCIKCRVPLTVTGYMEKEKESLEMKEQMNKIQQQLKSSLELSSKQNIMIGDVMSMYDKLKDDYNDLKGLLAKSMSTTKTVFGRMEELESDMRGGLLIKLGKGPGDARLTPEEERKVMELIKAELQKNRRLVDGVLVDTRPLTT